MRRAERMSGRLARASTMARASRLVSVCPLVSWVSCAAASNASRHTLPIFPCARRSIHDATLAPGDGGFPATAVAWTIVLPAAGCPVKKRSVHFASTSAARARWPASSLTSW